MSSPNTLATRAKNGDQSAILPLWLSLQDTARAVVRRYAGTASVDSDDLLQHAFLALLEAVRAYDDTRGDFKTIFIYHVRHTCGRALHLHRRGIEEVFSLDKPVGDDGETTVRDLIKDEDLIPVQDQMEQGELNTALHAALEALPERWRVALVGHDAQGLAYAVVGRQLGCSQQNAQRLRDCAIRRLRKDERLARLYRAT